MRANHFAARLRSRMRLATRAAGLACSAAGLAITAGSAAAGTAPILEYKGEWTEGKTYRHGDTVAFRGLANETEEFWRWYVWTGAAPSRQRDKPSVSPSWQPLTALRQYVRVRGAWDHRKTYVRGDTVTYKDHLYVYVTSAVSKGRTPGTSAAWQEISSSARNILSGTSGKPVNTVGKDGDYHVDTPTGTIYGPKRGFWPDGIRLQGHVGDSGPEGETGPKGSMGLQGPRGDTGPQGASLGKGLTGDQGPVGVRGAAGPVGPAGPAGPQGPRGAALAVVDKAGAPVGILSANQVIVTTPDGPVALDGITPMSYEGATSYFYTSPDCSGQAYWHVPSLLQTGRIMGDDGAVLDQHGNAFFSGKLTYARAPVMVRIIRSMRNDGTCIPYEGDGISLTAGPAAFMDVNWEAPLKLGN